MEQGMVKTVTLVVVLDLLLVEVPEVLVFLVKVLQAEQLQGMVLTKQVVVAEPVLSESRDKMEMVMEVSVYNLVYLVQQPITVVEVEVDYILQELLAPVV
jgi:hypothetical protein